MYDVNFFLDFYSKIPPEKWCQGEFTCNDRHCALGHLGVDQSNIGKNGVIKGNKKAVALAKILEPVSIFTEPYEIVFLINDSDGNPKDNIITALNEAKELSQSEANLKEASKLINQDIKEDTFLTVV